MFIIKFPFLRASGQFLVDVERQFSKEFLQRLSILAGQASSYHWREGVKIETDNVGVDIDQVGRGGEEGGIGYK